MNTTDIEVFAQCRGKFKEFKNVHVSDKRECSFYSQLA